MNRVSLLLKTPAVALRRFDHPPGEPHRDPEHEVSALDSINFVEGGGFAVRLAGKQWSVAPGEIFVTTRGMGFSCCHDGDVPSDRCLSVTYAEGAVEDLRTADVPALRPPVARTSQRQSYLRHRLRTCGPGQEIRLELLAGALFESMAKGGRAPRVRIDDQASDLMRRVDRAVELIEAEFDRTLTLGDLAGAACLSPFHFARIFRELTGMPPHRYLTAVRLRRAAARLDQGASVTTTCFEVGFGSLSHFVTSFRLRFGITPSEARRTARFPALRSSLSAPLRRRR